MPQPLSVTHRHLLSCVNTVLNTSVASRVTRILDVGCGDGLLIKYLAQSFSVSHPGREIEIFGMDVHDHGVQAPGYWAKTRDLLSGTLPSTDWGKRLHLVSISDPWPYPACYFDVVVSNQVLEHVGDHHDFFLEHRRVLSSDGVGFHLFPLHHCFIEPHLMLPFVHWVDDQGRRKTAIAMTTRLGLGKFAGPGHERGRYAASQSEYLAHQVNYQTQRGIAAAAAAAGLAPSFARTHFYYLQKLRSVMRRPFVEAYPSDGSLMARALAGLLRYVSSVTLELRPSGESAARIAPDGNRRRIDA